MKLEIRTGEEIFESITQSKYHYNIQAQTLAEYEYDLNQRWQPVDENIEWLEDFYFDLTDATQMREDLWIKVLERIKVLKGERE